MGKRGTQHYFPASDEMKSFFVNAEVARILDKNSDRNKNAHILCAHIVCERYSSIFPPLLSAPHCFERTFLSCQKKTTKSS